MDFDEDDFPPSFFGDARERWEKTIEAIQAAVSRYAREKVEPGFREAEALRKKAHNPAALERYHEKMKDPAAREAERERHRMRLKARRDAYRVKQGKKPRP